MCSYIATQANATGVFVAISLIHTNDYPPSHRTSLSDGTGKTSSPPPRYQRVPPPFGADRPCEYFHVAAKLPASGLVMHLALSRSAVLLVQVCPSPFCTRWASAVQIAAQRGVPAGFAEARACSACYGRQGNLVLSWLGQKVGDGVNHQYAGRANADGRRCNAGRAAGCWIREQLLQVPVRFCDEF